MLNLDHATNHRGHEGIMQQMRGRISWEAMNKEAKELIRTCEPCQINARSHKQDKTEISHKNMFNLHPNHTVHVDYCEYGGRDYIVVVDRVTGYIKAEQTPNQGTDAAIAVIKNWGLLFGYPMRVISDAGGGFRKDLKKKLKMLNIRHTHSSAYHPQSNSLAERAVGSLKGTLIHIKSRPKGNNLSNKFEYFPRDDWQCQR